MPTTRRSLLVAMVGVAGLVLAASTILGIFVDKRYREWSARADSALAFAEHQSARADSLAIEASNANARADSIAAAADTAAPIIRERIRVVRDTVQVPDTCVVIVAQRDSIIDDLVVEADQRQSAFAEQRLAFARLESARLALALANDSLTTVLQERERPRPAWLPTLDLGLFAGLCLEGPCAGIGVGITWEVDFPWP